jgi:hypothetical protein
LNIFLFIGYYLSSSFEEVFMSVTFHSYSPPSPLEPCPICLDSLDEQSVAHGKENWHPMCKKCALVWFKTQQICPTCKNSADISFPLPLKERFTRQCGRGLQVIPRWISENLRVRPFCLVLAETGSYLATKFISTIEPSWPVQAVRIVSILNGTSLGSLISRSAIEPQCAALFYSGLSAGISYAMGLGLASYFDPVAGDIFNKLSTEML